MSQELILAAPEGQRYSCSMCGWCCRWWRVEVTRAERDRLLAHDWAAENPRLGGVRLFDEQRLPGHFQPVIQTAHDLGQCVFLDDDNLCIIHKALGEDAKPATCRRFPLVIGYGGDGPMVGADYSCSAMVRNEGRPLVELVSGSAEWLLQQVHSRHWEPDLKVSVDGTFEAGWDAYLLIEAALLQILEQRQVLLGGRLQAGEDLPASIIDGHHGGSLLTEELVAHRLDLHRDEILAVAGDTRPEEVGRLLSWAEMAPMIGDVEVPHTRASGRGSRAIGYAMAIAGGSGRIYLSTLRLAVDLDAAAAVEVDLDEAGSGDHLTRFLCNYLLRKALPKCGTLTAGWEYLRTCVSLIRWYAAAAASGHGRTIASAEDMAKGIQVVEKAFVP